MRVTLLAVVFLGLLTACQTTKGSYCAIEKPIRLSDAAVDALSDAEVERILVHNETGQRICGWKQ